MFPILSAALSLCEFAPLMTRWLAGGQASQVAHHIVDAARRITGENHLEGIVKSFQDHPALILDFQKTLIERERDWERMVLHDRESARVRDIAWIKSGRRNRRADIMVISAAVGLILCLVALGYYADHLPGEAVGIISTIAGIFGACLKDAYAFEFGSSRGSREKDATVSAMLERS